MSHAARVDSIRLGPRRVPTVPLRDDHVPAIQTEVERVDWDAVLTALPLSAEEREFLRLRLDGASYPEIAAQEQWSVSRVDRVRKRVARKAQRFPALTLSEFVVGDASSTLLSYQERLASGRKSWQLTRVDSALAEVMLEELFASTSFQTRKHVQK